VEEGDLVADGVGAL
jgi:hypothetical protein